MTTFCLLLASLLTAPCVHGEWFAAIIEGPVYPVLGTQAQLMGVVRLRVTLDGQGEVSAVKIISGHPVLARAAVDNVERWAFLSCGDKGQQGGRDIEVTYDYRLEGTPNLRPRTRFRYQHPYKVTVIAEAQHWMPAGSTPK